MGAGHGPVDIDPTVKAEQPSKPGDAPFCVYPAPKVSPKAWTQRVPSKVVSALLDPGSTLVVGDAPGDPDCFCSAVALARARQALHLPAEAHVDAPAPQQVQGVLRPDELADGDAVKEKTYDTVLFVDNDGTRVGDAATEAMRRAKRVVVIDHHDVDPTHDSLGLPPETELVVWKDTGADAAALMALASILRAVEDSGAMLFQSTWKAVLEPLISGVYSDTRGFEAARTRPATVGLLQTVLDTDAVDLKATLRGFGGGIPKALREALAAAVEEQPAQIGETAFGGFTLPGARLLELWNEARDASPELTWSDMLFAALDHVEARVREADYDTSLFVVGAQGDAADALPEALRGQLPPKAHKFSVRTKDADLAPRLAAHLGGGGKPHEGGGVSDADAEALHGKAQAFLQKRADLVRQANLFNLGGV